MFPTFALIVAGLALVLAACDDGKKAGRDGNFDYAPEGPGTPEDETALLP